MKARSVQGLKGLAILMASAPVLLVSTMPAQAQISDEITVNILRECAKIDDPSARLACYDNNIRPGGSDSLSPARSLPRSSSAASAGTQGFGNESIKRDDRFDSREERGTGADEISASVAKVRAREPGIYDITLADGAVWRFADSVSKTYRLPRAGDTVEIQRASLGSFLFTFEGQRAVRVRRVK